MSPADASNRPCLPAIYAAALQALEGDESLLREVAVVFVDGAPQTRAALRTALAAGDASAVRHIAHALNGDLALFACWSASSLAERVEVAAGRGDLDTASRLIPQLDQAVAEVVEGLWQGL